MMLPTRVLLQLLILLPGLLRLSLLLLPLPAGRLLYSPPALALLLAPADASLVLLSLRRQTVLLLRTLHMLLQQRPCFLPVLL